MDKLKNEDFLFDCENRSFRKGLCMFSHVNPKQLRLRGPCLAVSTFTVLLKIIIFMQINSQMLSWLFHSNQPVQCTEWDIFFQNINNFINIDNFQISILFLLKNCHCVVLVKRQFYIVINWKYCGLQYDLKRSLWGTETQDNAMKGFKFLLKPESQNRRKSYDKKTNGNESQIPQNYHHLFDFLSA